MRLGGPLILSLGAGAALAAAIPALPLGLPRAAASAAWIAALTLGMDAWLAREGRTPLYRRHLAVFGLGLGASALGALGAAGFAPAIFLAGTASAALGLAVRTLPVLRGRNLARVSWAQGSPRRPDPRRLLILVADPHWSGPLRGLEEAAAAFPEADWLFLGDVFDVWVGLPGMETAAQRTFLDWVGSRRAAGRWVGLWMGNREYFLDRHADAFDLLGEGTGGALEGEALAFEHGDWINPADWRYRAWNLLSRSGPMWALVRCLPASLAQGLARTLERRLRTTNRAYKLAFPGEAFASAAAASGDRTFVTGHFHTLERRGNGLALPWAFEGAFWAWREGRLEPLEPAGAAQDSTSRPGVDPTS
jgi:UDP-2,3-diacylglucosamine pyrophosphatase LpxH